MLSLSRLWSELTVAVPKVLVRSQLGALPAGRLFPSATIERLIVIVGEAAALATPRFPATSLLTAVASRKLFAIVESSIVVVADPVRVIPPNPLNDVLRARLPLTVELRSVIGWAAVMPPWAPAVFSLISLLSMVSAPDATAIPPPWPLVAASLALTVERLRLTVPFDAWKMPPPVAAELPVMVVSVAVRLPELSTAMPPPWPTAELSSTTTRLRVSCPSVRKPPPCSDEVRAAATLVPVAVDDRHVGDAHVCRRGGDLEDVVFVLAVDHDCPGSRALDRQVVGDVEVAVIGGAVAIGDRDLVGAGGDPHRVELTRDVRGDDRLAQRAVGGARRARGAGIDLIVGGGDVEDRRVRGGRVEREHARQRRRDRRQARRRGNGRNCTSHPLSLL